MNPQTFTLTPRNAAAIAYPNPSRFAGLKIRSRSSLSRIKSQVIKPLDLTF